MKYYLDVNAVVELYERDYKIENELTYISSLTISEMCKNLDNNFKRQKSQFEFIENSKIKINWKQYHEIIFGDAFDIDYPRSRIQVKYIYSAILQNEDLTSFKNNFLPLVLKNTNLENDEYANSFFMKDFMSETCLSFINFYYNMLWEEINSKREYFLKKKIYEIKKELLKSFLLTNFKAKCIGELTAKNKSEFRKILKGYNGSIDLFLDSSSYYYKNANTVERNDAPDLLHLTYLGLDDIFVTQDKKLKTLCDKVSKVRRVITIEEYLNRVNTNK